MNPSRRTIAVIGAGWAGCAAAVELCKRGHRVLVFEAARTPGGRARRIEIDGRTLDNGQHILLGAYTETLRLMRAVGLDPSATMLNLPLQMRYPRGGDGMDFIAPRLPAPLHLLVALLRARGLRGEDKMSLARFSTTARWMGWTLHTDCSVTELLNRFDQTDRLIRLMWRPLCIAALNTPPERASAQVFLNVLRDSLGARRAASDMLIPRVDLTALFPQQAAAFVEQHGGTVQCGAAVKSIRHEKGGWRLATAGQAQWFDGVVIATPPNVAATLLRDLQAAASVWPEQHKDHNNQWKATITTNPSRPPDQNNAGTSVTTTTPSELLTYPAPSAEGMPASAVTTIPEFSYEPITTCYLAYPPTTRLPHVFLALEDDPATHAWGQFVFDRGQLNPSEAGLLAVVVSASAEAIDPGHPALAAGITAQLARAFDAPHLNHPKWLRIVSEKRATYSCLPNLARPSNATGFKGLVLAGDYTAGDYPATLEQAVRSGVAAAALV